MEGSNMRTVNFNKANISGISFKQSKLTYCSFLESNLVEVNFHKVIFEHPTVYDGAYLNKCDFTDTGNLDLNTLIKAARLLDSNGLDTTLKDNLKRKKPELFNPEVFPEP